MTTLSKASVSNDVAVATHRGGATRAVTGAARRIAASTLQSRSANESMADD